MSLRIDLDQPFGLPNNQHVFMPLGSPRGNKGETYTAFLGRPLFGGPLKVHDMHDLSGVCRVYTVQEGALPVGVIFVSPTTATLVQASVLSIVVPLYGRFDPCFLYESFQLMLFIADNGSITAVPKTNMSHFLVPVVEQEEA